MKKVIAILVVINVMFFDFSVFAAEVPIQKNETVYVNLDKYGNVNKINAYNEYYFQNIDKIVDYGKYLTYQNLTNRLNPTEIDNGLEWNVNGINRLAYICEIENSSAINIPWNIDISYQLNGVDINAENLLNANGLIKVIINVEANKEANEYYQNNYMMEITSSFDMNKYLSVKCENATEVMTGNTKTMMLIVLPGQSKTFEIEIGSNEFEMDGLTFAMIPLQGDIFDIINKLVDNREDIEDAFDNLNFSTDIILNSMNKMIGGINSLINGTTTLKLGTDKIYNLSDIRNQDIETVKVNLGELNSLTEITNKNIDKLKDKVNTMNTMLKETNQSLNSINKDLDNISKDLEELAKDAEKLPKDFKNINELISNSKNLLKSTKNLLQAQLQGSNYDTSTLQNSLLSASDYVREIGNNANTQMNNSITIGDMENARIYGSIALSAKNIGDELGTVNIELTNIQEIMNNAISASKGLINQLDDIRENLSDTEDNIDRIIDESENIPIYIDDVKRANDNINNLIGILTKYIDKYLENENDINESLTNLQDILFKIQEIEVVSENMLTTLQATLEILDTEIYEGTSNISTGMINVLSDSLEILNQSKNVKDSKDTIRNISKERIDEIFNETNIFNIDSDAKVVSFTSEKNEQINKVQILLKSDSIKEIDNNNVTDIEPKKEAGTIWQRIVSVLKKILSAILSIFKKK